MTAGGGVGVDIRVCPIICCRYCFRYFIAGKLDGDRTLTYGAPVMLRGASKYLGEMLVAGYLLSSEEEGFVKLLVSVGEGKDGNPMWFFFGLSRMFGDYVRRC